MAQKTKGLDLAASILEQSGADEDEVTDEQAEEVLAEIFGKSKQHENPEAKKYAQLESRTTKALDLAARMSRVAVANDSSGNFLKALEGYEKALTLFGEGICDAALGDKLAAQVMATMESYLDRALALRLLGAQDLSNEATSRDTLFQAMSGRGFNCLKRGVGLYRRAKEEKNNGSPDWNTYVLYREATECLGVYAHQPGTTANPVVKKCLDEMQEAIEAIKGRLDALGHYSATGSAELRNLN